MREERIDILRFVGISLIILAHVGAPSWINQIRCFDVPLMFFVSGLACSGKSIESYKNYAIKRAKRLLYPAWGFIMGYLILLTLLRVVLHKEPYSMDFYLESMIMTGGIGYVWIIRVFFLVALILPALLWIEKKLNTTPKTILTSLTILGGVILLYDLSSSWNSVFLKRFLYEWVITLASYCLPFLLGLKLRYLEYKEVKSITSALGIIFAVSVVVYYFTNGLPIVFTPNYKYPPYSYYVLYGVFVCCLLWLLSKLLVRLLGNRFFLFIGQNTIWIYFYHIPLLLFTSNVPWIYRYVLVYTISVSLFSLQYRLYRCWKEKYPFMRYFIG